MAVHRKTWTALLFFFSFEYFVSIICLALSYTYLSSILLKYRKFCNAYAAHRHYTGLTESNRIYFLLIDIIGRKFFRDFQLN